MGLDLYAYLDKNDGTYISLIKKFPRYRWFWERICKDLLDKNSKDDIIDSISPSITDSLRMEWRSNISKIQHTTNNFVIRDGWAWIGTYLSIQEFLDFNWNKYWKQYLSSAKCQKFCMDENNKTDLIMYKHRFDQFYNIIKTNSSEKSIIYFYWSTHRDYYPINKSIKEYKKEIHELNCKINLLQDDVKRLQDLNDKLGDCLKTYMI